MLQKEFHFRSLMVKDEDGQYRLASSDEIIEAALDEMKRRYRRGTTISSPEDTKAFLQLRLGHLEHEVFAVLWMDNRHRLIAFEELFRSSEAPSTGRACIRARWSSQQCGTTRRRPSSPITILRVWPNRAKPISASRNGCKRPLPWWM